MAIARESLSDIFINARQDLKDAADRAAARHAAIHALAPVVNLLNQMGFQKNIGIAQDPERPQCILETGDTNKSTYTVTLSVQDRRNTPPRAEIELIGRRSRFLTDEPEFNPVYVISENGSLTIEQATTEGRKPLKSKTTTLAAKLILAEHLSQFPDLKTLVDKAAASETPTPGVMSRRDPPPHKDLRVPIDRLITPATGPGVLKRDEISKAAAQARQARRGTPEPGQN